MTSSTNQMSAGSPRDYRARRRKIIRHYGFDYTKQGGQCQEKTSHVPGNSRIRTKQTRSSCRATKSVPFRSTSHELIADLVTRHLQSPLSSRGHRQENVAILFRARPRREHPSQTSPTVPVRRCAASTPATRRASRGRRRGPRPPIFPPSKRRATLWRGSVLATAPTPRRVWDRTAPTPARH